MKSLVRLFLTTWSNLNLFVEFGAQSRSLLDKDVGRTDSRNEPARGREVMYVMTQMLSVMGGTTELTRHSTGMGSRLIELHVEQEGRREEVREGVPSHWSHLLSSLYIKDQMGSGKLTHALAVSILGKANSVGFGLTSGSTMYY